jgi:hypothetical protein
MRDDAEGESLPVGRVTAIVGRGGGALVQLALDAQAVPGAVLVAGLAVGELVAGTRLRVGPALVELGEASGTGGIGDAEVPDALVAARVVQPAVVRCGDPVSIASVPVPLEDVLDLHPFRPAEVEEVVAEYLARAQAAGLEEVRLIHGRGRGVQRETVRRLLAGSPLVVAFADAPPERGGWGATVARLRPAS